MNRHKDAMIVDLDRAPAARPTRATPPDATDTTIALLRTVLANNLAYWLRSMDGVPPDVWASVDAETRAEVARLLWTDYGLTVLEQGGLVRAFSDPRD